VTENVLPAEQIVIVRSHMWGREAKKGDYIKKKQKKQEGRR